MKKAVKTTLLTSALLVSGLALAGPFGGHGRGDGHCAAAGGGVHFGAGEERRVERLIEKLDLSGEQRSAVRAILDAKRPAMRELRDSMSENRKALFALMHRDDVTEAGVRTLAEQQGDYLTDSILLRAEIRSEISKVLSEEQREQLRALSEARRERFAGQL